MRIRTAQGKEDLAEVRAEVRAMARQRMVQPADRTAPKVVHEVRINRRAVDLSVRETVSSAIHPTVINS